MKVDYEKTYESARWEFIHYMMQMLGFCEKQINLN